MTRNKTKNLILFILCVFILSLIYTIIDNHTNYNSAYTFGYSTGQNFRYILKIFGTLALIVFAFRGFKTRKTKNSIPY